MSLSTCYPKGSGVYMEEKSVVVKTAVSRYKRSVTLMNSQRLWQHERNACKCKPEKENPRMEKEIRNSLKLTSAGEKNQFSWMEWSWAHQLHSRAGCTLMSIWPTQTVLIGFCVLLHSFVLVLGGLYCCSFKERTKEKKLYWMSREVGGGARRSWRREKNMVKIHCIKFSKN